MRKNYGAKPWTYPQPVFILAAYDKDGKPNAMNAAWGGISEENQIAVCISAGHKTTENILASGAFTVSMATAGTVVPCDYVGVVSGNTDPMKMEKSGFTCTKSEFVNAPVINELPMTVECKLISYNSESCILLGEIVNVSAEESILDEKGLIDTDKLQPITFDPVHNTYRTVGAVVGKAFGDGLRIAKA